MKPAFPTALPACVAASVAATALAGCNGSTGGPTLPEPTATPITMPEPTTSPTPGATPLPASPTLKLVPFADPWARAEPRWRDIANNLYSDAFRASFSYARSSVALTYERSPSTPYFTGRIEARGLKPNFAYQVKLAGKPIYGSRGFGDTGSVVNVTSRGPEGRPYLGVRQDAARKPLPITADDWANQQLGYAGRWWDDTLPPGTNLDDAYYRTNYPRHTVYGYLFLGNFVTDSQGSASAAIAGSHSYHITWQDEQRGAKDVVFGTFPVRSSPDLYGYGSAITATQSKLWYEYEPSRARSVRLKAGTYHCRALVTEEAFHTEGGEGGGIWQTVLATEESRDRSDANDIVFSIR